MPNRTVKFLAKETSGRAAQTVSLEIDKWKTTGAEEGDIVTLKNLNGSNLTITIIIGAGGPFTNNSIVGPLNPGDEETRRVASGTSGKEYKYSVTAPLYDGDNFSYDPRFIFN